VLFLGLVEHGGTTCLEQKANINHPPLVLQVD
jgi:hypothetical protein